MKRYYIKDYRGEKEVLTANDVYNYLVNGNQDVTDIPEEAFSDETETVEDMARVFMDHYDGIRLEIDDDDEDD